MNQLTSLQEVLHQEVVPQIKKPTLLEEIQACKDAIMKGATNAELSLFAKFCEKTKLDPFSRQIYAINRGGNWTYQTSIDGFRIIAERSGLYEGQTPVYWCGNDGVWVDVWLKKEPPFAAKVGVYKKNHREPTWAVAKFDEYCQKYGNKLGGLWAKMPDLMIAKCSESLALRKAFPNDLSGIYTSEEMAQADNEKVENQSNAMPIVKVKQNFQLSDKQISRFHALRNQANVDEKVVKDFLASNNISSVKDLSKNQYDLLCNKFLSKIEESKKVNYTVDEIPF